MQNKIVMIILKVEHLSAYLRNKRRNLLFQKVLHIFGCMPFISFGRAFLGHTESYRQVENYEQKTMNFVLHFHIIYLNAFL